MSSVKRIVVTVVVFLVFLVLLFIGIYLFFADEPDTSPTDIISVLPLPENPLGVSTTTPISQIDLSFLKDDFSGDEIGSDAERDDRVYTEPLSGGGEAVETKENLPRLVRLFEGPTAGYRIDQSDDGSWVVKVVERGRGDRYRIQTVPYSLEPVAQGEFTRAVEAYPFANDEVLVLYESAEDETVVRSAFVPFFITDAGTRVQRFEDNIRVATNNENLLFFIQVIDGKSVGVVVDVSNPGETRVVWGSEFTTWIPRWGRASHITLHTPATGMMKGRAYLVDPKGVLHDDQFVSFSSGGSVFVDTSSGYFVLYEAGSDPANFAGNTIITTTARKPIIDLSVATLPEKCDGFNGVFVCAVPKSIPSETFSGYETVFPDSWYQGDISFSDAIVMVNAVTGERRLLLSPDQREIRVLSRNDTFDVTHPRISEDGKLLFFVNKRDRSLWMLRLDV